MTMPPWLKKARRGEPGGTPRHARRMKISAALLALLGVLVSTRTNAQSLWPVSFEIGMGVGKASTSGEYRRNTNGNTLDALSALRLRTMSHGAVVASLGFGLQGTGGVTTICLPRSTGAGCIPKFPQFTAFSALVGWETRHANLRVLGGPALVRGDSSSTNAWMGRIDLATPPVLRLSLLAFFRAAVVPYYEGDSFRFQSMGIGLRLR
jgi:hypothetical protein